MNDKNCDGCITTDNNSGQLTLFHSERDQASDSMFYIYFRIRVLRQFQGPDAILGYDFAHVNDHQSGQFR